VTKRETAAEAATTEDRPTPDEAREWIRVHPDEMRGVSITLEGEISPAAHRRLLEILFAPRTDRPAA
jgi:hypothetical protein